MKYSEELRKRLEEEDIADWHGLMQKPEVIWALLREIDRLNAERRWHKYPDEKPEGQECIIATDGLFVQTTYFDSCNKNALKYWQYLPEPPESEGRMVVKLIYSDNHVDHYEMRKWLPEIRVAEQKMVRFMDYPVTVESMTYKPSWFIRTFDFHSEVDGMWLYKERIG